MVTLNEERLRKRISWLNTVGGFEHAIAYPKVIEAAQGLSDGKIMEILKGLEESYSKVWDPMGWILTSIERARQAQEGLDSEVDAQLRRRIRWLNSEGGFENNIVYSKVVEAAVGVQPRRVMEVLRYLEESWDWVDDPTAWVCAGLRRSFNDGSNGWDYSEHDVKGKGKTHMNGKGKDNGKGKQGGKDAGKNSCGKNSWEWSQQHWYNEGWSPDFFGKGKAKGKGKDDFKGKGKEHISGYDVVDFKGQGKGKGDFKGKGKGDFKGKGKDDGKGKGKVETKGKGKFKAKWESEGEYDDFYGKLWRRIMWLNTNGGFENGIQYPRVVEAAESVDPDKVFELLNYVEENWHKVGDPTSWLCSSLQKATHHSQSAEEWPEESKDGKIRKRIRWLNSVGGFENSLIYSKISEASWNCEVYQVMEVFKYLEDHWDKINDPTSWVCTALRRNAAQTETNEGDGGWGFSEWDVDFDRKLRTRIRWLNNDGGFENTINYSKIAEACVGAPYGKVLTALKYLEEKGPYAIEDPTSWVCAGIRKAQYF